MAAVVDALVDVGFVVAVLSCCCTFVVLVDDDGDANDDDTDAVAIFPFVNKRCHFRNT